MVASVARTSEGSRWLFMSSFGEHNHTLVLAPSPARTPAAEEPSGPRLSIVAVFGVVILVL
jgi:hypothetical protein